MRDTTTTNCFTKHWNQQFKGRLKVGQNFPNPFNQITTINLSLSTTANVQIIIYNSLGQIVSKSVNSNYSKGNHSLSISADNLENGIYTYFVIIDNQNSFSGRMIVSK
ncbi:MAG: T9SS type A sorting domain-containing protein [Bacteroidetes bacterium]|nr:T9SS type A sorting domain-containing protein [Bacteroidota bacterium]